MGGCGVIVGMERGEKVYWASAVVDRQAAGRQWGK